MAATGMGLRQASYTDIRRKPKELKLRNFDVKGQMQLLTSSLMTVNDSGMQSKSMSLQ